MQCIELLIHNMIANKMALSGNQCPSLVWSALFGAKKNQPMVVCVQPQRVPMTIVFGGEFENSGAGRVTMYNDFYKYNHDKSQWTRIICPTRLVTIQFVGSTSSIRLAIWEGLLGFRKEVRFAFCGLLKKIRRFLGWQFLFLVEQSSTEKQSPGSGA